MSSKRELASGKLLLDEPGKGIARLRISNPDRRGALDHEILDALAETVPGLRARCLVITRGIRISMPPAKLGLVYSHTGLRKFLDLCGPANTAELVYVGRHIEAERAQAMGLVNHVVKPAELEQRVTAMASVIAANAPLSLSGDKEVLRTLRAHAAALPEDVERRLIELREACFRSEDFREGVRAFGEKRPPEWRGR